VRKGLWVFLVNSNESLVSFNDFEAKKVAVVAIVMDRKAKATAIPVFTPRNMAKPKTSSATIIDTGF
jgi:hypothetical protein